MIIEILVTFIIGLFIDMEFAFGIAGGIVGLFIITILFKWIDPLDSFRVHLNDLSKTQFYRLVVICIYAIVFPVHVFLGNFHYFPQEFYCLAVAVILFAVCTLFRSIIWEKICKYDLP